jgi:integrase
METIKERIMLNNNKSRETAEDLLALLNVGSLNATLHRDMKSAVNRTCEMAGCAPRGLLLHVPILRETLRKIRPAAHGVSCKTWANIRSLFGRVLEVAGVIDRMGMGIALRHPMWGPLMKAVAHDKRLSNGLAAFANRCAARGIAPEQVDDDVLREFHAWLEDRTLCPKPRDVVRRVPHLWNEVSEKMEVWPEIKLTTISFKAPFKRHQWEELSESFREDAQAYQGMRADPDLFDERPNAPRRPLAASTLRQQSEHLRLSASILIESGTAVEDITSLADLVQAERFKVILRYYHERANRKPNAFVICLAKTLIQVAQYHVGGTAEEVDQLKRFASKLPAVPFDLTAKNKALLRQFESDRSRANLLFLPEQLMAEVAKGLERGRVRFVYAQVGIAIDIQLAMPLRPQNLSSLQWRRHFVEPDGSKGRLLLHIPKEETKNKLQDIVAELPDDVARRLRWYRRNILPRLGADPNGPLFVTENGDPKPQETLSDQMTKLVERLLGLHMTPHQPRHLAATWYLDEHPEDFQTPLAALARLFGRALSGRPP